MSKKTSRVFFTIDLEQENKKYLGNLINQLEKEKIFQHVRFSKPENLHVTLRFLGNVADEAIGSLCHKITAVLHDFPCFQLTIREIMLFPNPLKPKVLACKVLPLAPQLALADKIEPIITACGFPPVNHPLVSHLTLGHIKGHIPQDIPQFTFSELSLVVNAIYLFKSDTRPTGAAYTPLYKFNLAVS